MLSNQRWAPESLGQAFYLSTEEKKIAYTWAPSLESLKSTPASETQLLSIEQYGEVERAEDLQLKT